MSDGDKNFLISIIPLTRISLSRSQFFYYLHNKKIPNGSLVSIPLGKRKIEGVVINSKPDFKRLGNIRLKKINTMIEEKFLTPEQLQLAEFISDYYIVSEGIVLKLFIPRKIKARNRKELSGNKPKIKKIILTKIQRKIIKKISKTNTLCKMHYAKYYLYAPASSGKTEIYAGVISEIKKCDSKSQFLILLPELNLLPQAIDRYGAYFNENEMAILNGKISKGQFYQNWQKIKTGEAKIILGTRQTVFAPFKNLKLIIVDEEQDISFKQWDRSPRYDARTTAEKLAEIHKTKIIFGSATPGIESYYKALNKKYELLKLPGLQNYKNQWYTFPGKIRTIVASSRGELNSPSRSPKQTSKLIKKISKINRSKPLVTSHEIVDMRREKWIKNYSPISKKLESEIKYVLKNNFQAILFVNRQGMSAFSVCKNCRTVLKCPICDRALVYQKEGNYKCLHCNYQSSVFPKCPKCQGINFKNVGWGTQKVEAEIKKLFPFAKTVRADFETMKKIKAQEDLYQKFSKNKISILVGTQMIIKGWDLQNIGLIGIIDADNLLNIPDFRTNEKAFQNLVQVSGRTGRLGSRKQGKVIIQTYDPENFIIKTASEMDFEKFYRREIKERKTLNYPPFIRLVKIIFRNASEEKTKKEVYKIYQAINKKLKNKKNIQVIAPHSPLVPKVRGRFKQQIVIKIKSEKVPVELKKILEKLGIGWIIDVDPINII